MSKTVGQLLQQQMEDDEAYSFYKYFEPWDVGERNDEVYRLAEKDGVDLYHEDYIKTKNVGPHPFQSGYLMSSKPVRVNLGPTQGGKSVTAMIEIGCMCSGEFPISMQYDKGVDTGVKRIVNEMNIRRWGRRDAVTGQLIDYDLDVERDGSWDCGTIIGAGKYPKEKVIPDTITEETTEKVIWIGTTRRALEESWWPKMTKGQMLPEKFIDRTKGNKGTNQSDGNHVIHLKRNIRLSIISYESGYDKFEAVKVWACFFDEEARDREAVTAALSHCKYFAVQMTPYNGMTYTKDLFFKSDPNIDLFHATAYDSPYITKEDIDLYRATFPDHQIAARIWGEHTTESQMPYYSANKTRSWIKQISTEPTSLRATFMPSEDYHGVKRPHGSNMPALMDIEAKCEIIGEDEGKDDRGHNVAWTIYEDLMPGAAYCIVSDAANGADIPEDAGDFQAAVVLRKPKLKGEDTPIVVAEIETTVTPDRFAQLVGVALRYYGNALLCAESPRAGSANGMFFSEMREYPYWFMRSVPKKSTNKFLTQQGFDTNAATRKGIFDEIEKVFGQYTEAEMPTIPSRRILQMAAECTRVIKNGKIKPDHPRNKPNDLLVCYGIGLVVFKTWPEQIRCRVKSEKTVAKYPKDCVISLLTAKRKKESCVDPHFPCSTGGRR